MTNIMNLKHKIERGEYRISNERIAEAIVARLAEQPNPLDPQRSGAKSTSSPALAA
jgi:hypothetical protein